MITAYNIYPQNYFPQRQDYPIQMPQQMQPQQMQQQMPPMQQSAPQAVQPIMRLVTSRAEAEVAQIPFDGSAAYFMDTSNGKIYAKALRTDGTDPLIVYSREGEASPANFVTQEQFDVVIKKMTELEKAVYSDE